jgi:hypothetical protein
MSWQDDMQAVSAAIAQRGQPQGPPMPTEEDLRRLLAARRITPEQYAQMTGRPPAAYPTEPQGPPAPVAVGSAKYARDFFNPFSRPPPGGYTLPPGGPRE